MTAEYKPFKGTDGRGDFMYGQALGIKCRRQQKVQNVLTDREQVVKTLHIYYTHDEVHEGDMLDGRIVVSVSVMTDLGGKTIGYKAVV